MIHVSLLGAIAVNARVHYPGTPSPIFSSVGLIVSIIALVGLWKTLTKADQYGWSIFIPFYNAIVLLRVAQKPWWWIFLYLIPLVNIVVACIVNIKIAHNFGKGTGFGLGLLFLGFIFFPILGFGSAQYLPRLPIRTIEASGSMDAPR